MARRRDWPDPERGSMGRERVGPCSGAPGWACQRAAWAAPVERGKTAWRMALMAARFLLLRRRLKRDPDARAYTDRALTPVAVEGGAAADADALALFSVTDAAHAPVGA
jgi:hypothetical protein